jgi:dihydrofolate reductase
VITLYAAVSLDGCLAGADDDLSWLEIAGRGGRDGDYGYGAFYRSVDVTVMGRATWEVARGFDPWPYAGKPCVVLSRSAGLRPVAGETFERFDPARWRERGEREHVYLCGGGETARLFLAEGLVDRIQLALVPALLGRGKPLFPAGFPESRWVLLASESHPTGVVQVAYRRG